VVEPLETVSVTITPTEKKDIKEFGDIQAVAETLAKEVLTAPGQEVEVKSTNEVRGGGWGEEQVMKLCFDLPHAHSLHPCCETHDETTTTPKQHRPPQRETKGKTYYEFEFTAKAPRYTRHSVAVVTANDGKFYTLTTGANERRWGKMKDRLNTVTRSFSLIN